MIEEWKLTSLSAIPIPATNALMVQDFNGRAICGVYHCEGLSGLRFANWIVAAPLMLETLRQILQQANSPGALRIETIRRLAIEGIRCAQGRES